MSPKLTILYIAIGGFLGTIFRYLAIYHIPIAEQRWEIFLLNTIGSGILGVLTAVLRCAANNPIPTRFYDRLWAKVLRSPEKLRLLCGVGFCGSLTTFSSWAKILVHDYTQQQYLSLSFYVLCSVIGGTIIAMCGYLLATRGLRKILS